jgi:hypothetical protein
MSKLLLALHALLIITPILPVFEYSGDLQRPREAVSAVGEAREYARRSYCALSVLASGLPGFLALMNLPLVARRRPCWSALSSLMIGLLGSGLMAQLLARYGYGRLWGAWAVWGVSMALLVAGTAAWTRLSGRPCERCGHAA